MIITGLCNIYELFLTEEEFLKIHARQQKVVAHEFPFYFKISDYEIKAFSPFFLLKGKQL